ncbi:MAG TPA: radical SAM protein [Bacteroidales bacterium]|nr:radical SAM protein [Bacteroidales bacterium]
MIINFLYCIDYPAGSEKPDKADSIDGWLLCSRPLKKITLAEDESAGHTFEYGLSRPDVAQIFKNFPGNVLCGFTIHKGQLAIDMKKKLLLDAEILTAEGKINKTGIALDLKAPVIRDIEIDSRQICSEWKFHRTEKKYFKALKKHPWITIRMDITNKCNLRCIMCHYKEKEIYSRPAQNITPGELKKQLHDISPFVKHIMLSCGYEPLMSKYFSDILKMIYENYPHMEMAMCTNGMLLDSRARKAIIENKVASVLFSLDGATKNTVEKIRVGVNYEKVIGNIMALRDLKRKYNRIYPLMNMDFVLMNSNIHEAPAFVELCSQLGMELIDFRHLVGNVFFSEHDEMLNHNKEKYNFYRQRIIDEAKKFNIHVRLPEPFDVSGRFEQETAPVVALSDFMNVKPDVQTEDIIDTGDFVPSKGDDADFEFLNGADCLRPFNEIMIVDQKKILPCSYYSDAMAMLDDEKTSLATVFFNENYKEVRRKKILSRFDHNCINCPIKSNLLPTDIVR